MALTFLVSANGFAGVPLHITVYDASGVALSPTTNPVTWNGLPASVTVTPNATGYLFNSTAVVGASVVATQGLASGRLLLNFAAPPLQFTSP